MEQLISWVLQTILVSGVLAGYYWIALRNRKLHSYNRLYLLATLILSLLLPLVPIHWAPFATISRPILGGTVERVENFTRSADNGIPWVTIGCAIGGVLSLSLLLLSVRRVAQVFKLKSEQLTRHLPGYDLIETEDPRAPFSFLNNLFWRKNADLNDPVNKKIFSHELAHITGRHGWDSLFAQFLCCLFWLNPFFWIIRRELSVVHEFIADAATGMEGDGEGFARMLLYSINEGRFLEPAQGFFQSPIKRRLAMISDAKQSPSPLLRQLLATPVLFTVILLISCGKAQPAHTGTTPVSRGSEAIMRQKMDLDRKQQLVLRKLNLVLWGSRDTAVTLQLKREAELKALKN
jgi:hypothetical protein